MRKQNGKIHQDKQKKRYRRKLSIRKKIVGTTDKLRLCTSKTNKHLVVQLVDDSLGKTVFSMQTFGKNKVEGASKSVAGAKVFGEAVAKKLTEKGISTVLFDRNGRRYTGILATLADSLRTNGIKI